jgi:hypothetical protein
LDRRHEKETSEKINITDLDPKEPKIEEKEENHEMKI